MSDYVKPVKQCQDAPVGFRTVNQLAENQNATLELLAVEHEMPPERPSLASPVGDLGGFGGGLASLDVIDGGAHNTPKVARGTMGFDIDPNLYAIGSPIIVVRYRSGVCQQYIRVSTGVYFIPIVGLTSFYAEACPVSDDNTTTRKCEVTPTSTVTLSTASLLIVAPGVYVSCWQETTLDSGNVGFDVADFSFDLVVYGNRGTNLDDSRPAVFSSPRNVQRRSWRPGSRVFRPL